MTAPWLDAFAAVWIPLSVVAAAVVVVDILILNRRHAMPVMDVVWPVTMLYWGPLGLPCYFWFGRGKSRVPPPMRTNGKARAKRPMWQSVYLGSTHCGAGCALGDFIGDWIAFALGVTLFGSVFAGRLVLSFVLAYLFGLAFQYFAIAPMRGLSVKDGLVAAAKADTLSLLAYQVGMFAVMGAIELHLLPGLQPTTLAYWVTMQAAMLAGFVTTYPVNWVLIRAGVKEAM